MTCTKTTTDKQITTPSTGEIECTYTNTFDTTQQKAMLYIPRSYTDSIETPLLVVAHYWGGNRFTARDLGYYEECEKRGWIVLCPQLHGKNSDHRTALASLESQYDIIDGIRYVQSNYAIDKARIYIAGRSMGGMITTIMAAKHPDLFAAAVAGQPITDVHTWIQESPSFKESVEKECGGPYIENVFEYQRRSSLYYAGNLRSFPLIIWHGTNDDVVLPSHSELLHQKIQSFTSKVPPINWLYGAPHCADNYSPIWICSQLAPYRNIAECGMKISTRFLDTLSVTTDEDQVYYWLSITQREPKAFTTIDASIVGDTLFIKSENAQSMQVLRDRIPQSVHLTHCIAETDGVVDLIIETINDKQLLHIEHSLDISLKG